MKKGLIIALATALACTLVFALPSLAVPGGDSISNSANKVVAQGSTIEVFGAAEAAFTDSGWELDGDIDDAAPTIGIKTVDSEYQFRVFQMIQIDSEVLRITGIDYETDTLDVTRGVWCSEADSHTNEAAIKVWTIPVEETITLLEVTGKFSDPKDVLIQFTAESALFTLVKGKAKVQDDTPLVSQAEASAQVLVWVEIDGTPVPVTLNEERGGPDSGIVVFDNRAFGLKTLLWGDTEGDEYDEFIELYIATRSAHSFNWVAVDVGEYDSDYESNGNDLNIEVKAALMKATCTLNSGSADAEAAVGKRTLVVEPIKMATGSSY